MKAEHAISDEVLEIIQLAINRNENWIAYNNSLYFIDKADVHFFKEKDTAQGFASDNYNDSDRFNVIYVQSIADLLRQIPYGEALNKELNNLLTKNMSIMNEENFEYLSRQIKFTGFGEGHVQELKSKME